ncbi:MAG: hypothetical protein QME49_04125, partial [bacterium]|nr:hypothetical protein [bacterium]
MVTMSQVFRNLITFDQPLSLITNIGTLLGWVIGLSWGSIFFTKRWIRCKRRKKLLKFTSSAKGSIAISIGVGLNPAEDVKGFLDANFQDVPLVMKYSKLGNFSGEELLQIFEEIKSDFFDLMQRGNISEILL